MKEFKVPYWISNGGDGSVCLNIEPSLEIAEYNCNGQAEGWAENSASLAKLRLTDEGELQYYDYHAGKFQWITIPQDGEA